MELLFYTQCFLVSFVIYGLMNGHPRLDNMQGEVPLSEDSLADVDLLDENMMDDDLLYGSLFRPIDDVNSPTDPKGRSAVEDENRFDIEAKNRFEAMDRAIFEFDDDDLFEVKKEDRPDVEIEDRPEVGNQDGFYDNDDDIFAEEQAVDDGFCHLDEMNWHQLRFTRRPNHASQQYPFTPKL